MFSVNQQTRLFLKISSNTISVVQKRFFLRKKNEYFILVSYNNFILKTEFFTVDNFTCVIVRLFQRKKFNDYSQFFCSNFIHIHYGTTVLSVFSAALLLKHFSSIFVKFKKVFFFLVIKVVSYVLKFLIIVLKYFINFFQLLGLIVWRSVSSGCWYKPEEEPPFCMFNRSETTCSATSAIGFFSLATAIALLIMDAQFDKISAVQTRKRIVVLDMAVSGFLITFTFSQKLFFLPLLLIQLKFCDQFKWMKNFFHNQQKIQHK